MMDRFSTTAIFISLIYINIIAQTSQPCLRQTKRDKFESIIQKLLGNLEARSTAYLDLEEKFAFLTNLKSLKYEEISESCKKITSIYPTDLNENELIEECQIAIEYFDFEMEDFSHC